MNECACDGCKYDHVPRSKDHARVSCMRSAIYFCSDPVGVDKVCRFGTVFQENLTQLRKPTVIDYFASCTTVETAPPAEGRVSPMAFT